jgi:putative DNA primase/helicase
MEGEKEVFVLPKMPELARKILDEERQRELAYPERDTLLEVQEERAGHILGSIFDKVELAEKFIKLVPLYYDNSNLFWLWDLVEKYWRIIDEVDVLNIIDRSAQVNLINSKERTETLNAIKMRARANKPKDVPPTWIQFCKEVIDIETGDRFMASPEYFYKNPIPHRLGKESDTPKFDKVFSEWVKTPEEVKVLYEIIAYCILPAYPVERIFCLHGSGSNGKSVYRQILRKFIGEKNVCSTSLDLLTSSRFEPTKLFGKLVCEMGETNLSKLDNTQVIKRVVSGKDLIGGEFKNKPHFDFVNYAKIIISTNNLPPTEDKTDGFYRRWMIIDFPNRFEKEIDLMAQFTEEDYQNLAMKCVGIIIDLLKKRHFAFEGTIEERRERYEHRSNPFDKFFKEYVDDSDPNTDITKWDFCDKFNSWLKENKLRAVSEMSLVRIMKNKGIQEVKVYKDWFDKNNNGYVNRQVRCWGGIKWK